VGVQLGKGEQSESHVGRTWHPPNQTVREDEGHLCFACFGHSWARATFFESAIAIPQVEGSNSTIAIPQLFKEMLLPNHKSAIPQLQFFLKSTTSSPQHVSFTFAIFGISLAAE
jgi:hypothetical protein